MKQAILPNQRGAVLIFTLLMLLLLTLSGVSMIEQNKQQIAMMRNSRQQNQTLARAEQLLAQAENAIKNAKSINPVWERHLPLASIPTLPHHQKDSHVRLALKVMGASFKPSF